MVRLLQVVDVAHHSVQRPSHLCHRRIERAARGEHAVSTRPSVVSMRANDSVVVMANTSNALA